MMKNYNMILTEKRSSKISALSSGKTNKYEYLIDEEILPFNQSKMKQQAKFTYYSLRIASEKQAKHISIK